MLRVTRRDPPSNSQQHWLDRICVVIGRGIPAKQSRVCGGTGERGSTRRSALLRAGVTWGRAIASLTTDGASIPTLLLPRRRGSSSAKTHNVRRQNLRLRIALPICGAPVSHRELMCCGDLAVLLPFSANTDEGIAPEGALNPRQFVAEISNAS